MLYKLHENENGKYVTKDNKRVDLGKCKFAYCLIDDGILGRDTECGFDEFETDEEAIAHYEIVEYEKEEKEEQ